MAGEWTSATLGGICRFAAGSAFPLSEQGDVLGKYPFIKVSDMNLSGNERFITVANNWIGEKTKDRLRAKVHPEWATVFAKIGVALTYNRRRILPRPTLIDNNMMAAIPKDGVVNPLFFYYLLCTIDFNEVVVGTALPYLNISDLSRIMVKLPPLKEQQAIACILGALDDKIELNRKMNETLEAMAHALFKSWFVDFDPVRAKVEGRDTGLPKEIADLFPDEFEDSELGEIPEGWKIGPLSAVGRITKCSVNPGDLPTKIWEHYSIPAFDASRLALRETGDSIKSGKYRVPSTCVLVSKLNPQFPRVWLPSVQDEDAAICSTEFVPFLPQKTEWRSYLFELVTSDLVQRGIEQRVTGSTGSRQRVKPEDMASIPVVQPFSKVIDQFCLISRPLYDKFRELSDESHTLASLRDILLPRLISGELRVPEAERFIEQEALV